MQRYLTPSSGPLAFVRLLGYYVQRSVTSRTLRRAAAYATVAALRARHGRPAPSACDEGALRTLQQDGLVGLGQLLSARQCEEALAWLRQRDMIAARQGGRVFKLDAVPGGTRVGDYPLETVVNCPHILEVANHPLVLGLAARYFGYTPTVTLMGLRWSFPTGSHDADVQGFHRDSEPGSIKLMVYLTDVDADTGPHSYVTGTHHDRMPLRLRRYADSDIAAAHGRPLRVTGPAGTAFVIDGKGIHKGTPPERGPRLLLGIQYSLLPCLIYSYVPVAYHGTQRFGAYVNRLMVAQDGGARRRPAIIDEETAPSLQD